MTLFWYSEYLQAAWMLLAELAPAVQKFSHQFILDYWERHASSTEGEAPSGVSHACTVSVFMDGWKIEKWKIKSFNMDKSPSEILIFFTYSRLMLYMYCFVIV